MGKKAGNQDCSSFPIALFLYTCCRCILSFPLYLSLFLSLLEKIEIWWVKWVILAFLPVSKVLCLTYKLFINPHRITH